MQRILVDMSATLIHHGHIRLLKKASELGTVVVGLTSDEEIIKKKGYTPELSFKNRKEVLLSIKYVSEVIKTSWLITDEILSKNKIDLLVHGDDNSNDIKDHDVIIFERTAGVSSTDLRFRAHKSLVDKKNKKIMLTPGPSSICYQSINNLIPVFGRGDDEYQAIKNTTLDWLNNISGQDETISLIGSATCALEICIANFIRGKVLAIKTGYYSERLITLARKFCEVEVINFTDLDKVVKKFDWIIGCYTETSTGYMLDMKRIKALKTTTNAKLFLDSTGSIGLENDHSFADLVGYSSCKGLLGLTGASFISKKKFLKNNPQIEEDLPFYMRFSTHSENKITGPYNIINGLYEISKDHKLLVDNIKSFRRDFLERFQGYLIWGNENQPLLCTKITKKVKNSFDNIVVYQPRDSTDGSIICHLHAMDKKELNTILSKLKFSK